MDVEFGLQRGSQKGSLGKSAYISQLRRRLMFAHNKAKQMAKRQQARHKGLYNQKCRGAELKVGDLVLVKQTAWEGSHKIQDRWEYEEYQMVDQPTPGVPVYAVKSIAGCRPRVLHRNLLLPLQGRIRQEDGVGEEGSSDSKGENETPEVARVPSRRSRRTTKPHVNPTQLVDTPAILSEETHSELSSPSSPGTLSGDEDSSKGEEYATPLTSDTTTAIPASNAGAMEEEDSHYSQSTTSPLIPGVPCPDGSIPSDQATDRVSNEQDSEPDSDFEPNDTEQGTKSPVPPAPRRSVRSTKGIPPVCYGKIHIHSTIISELAKPTRYK